MTADPLEPPDGIVVAHDQMWEYGGAERVAIRMGEALEAPVVTTAAGADARAGATARDVDLVTFADRKYDRLRGIHRASGFKEVSLVLDWQTAPLGSYDVVLASGTATRHYRTTDGQYLLNYCHSPVRTTNDLLGDTVDRLPRGLAGLAKLYLTALDLLDGRSVDRVDAVLANSGLVAERVRRYYRREATVIYPPVDVPAEPTAEDRSGPDGATAAPHDRGEYFLFVGRLVPEKRPEVVLAAFGELDVPLKIVGPTTGAIGAGRFSREHPPNVEYLGTVSDERLTDLLRRAAGVVYVPVREDFGLVPVEALAVGTPVLAADEGFPARLVEDGETGVVVEPTVDGVVAGVRRLQSLSFDRTTLRAAAEPFAAPNFEHRLRAAVLRFLEDPEQHRLADEPLLSDPPSGRDPQTDYERPREPGDARGP